MSCCASSAVSPQGKVIYAGTFDPFTRGHEDIVHRSARLFDRVIVAIAASEHKGPLFSLDERVAMGKMLFSGITNVEVIGFSNLLMDFAKAQGASAILRGLRAASDFEYEFQLAGMNRQLCPEMETVFLTPADQYMFISASMVREIARFGGDVSRFVDTRVAEQLRQRFAQKR
ncbi:MAG: pantetheine-phosphate adenylyltransferase [Proteobacteria bacterium]|nr:pantetheine-phosphate adenylyltransferase [Pseudomonadota bacterium]MCL2309508.1 pantetheine-phosphate adenylyltransferase [Pseudomonadota bacterium]